MEQKSLVFALYRVAYREHYTIGRLFYKKDGHVHSLCDTLEPRWRDYAGGEKKVKGHSAIAAGTYKLILGYNSHMCMSVPQLSNVPQFEGVQIHPGNTYKDTAGCILPGTNDHVGKVSRSLSAFSKIFQLFLDSRSKGYSCQIIIIDAPDANEQIKNL